MAKLTYALVFSDLDFGHKDLGFIPRRPRPDRGEDAQEDDEDKAYARFLRSRGHTGVSVALGLAKVDAR